MERGALSTAEFREFGQKYVLFCHITSRVEGEPYPDLLSEKGGGGFPYLVAMDAEGDVLAIHRGPRTVEGFEATMQSAREFRDLLAREDLSKEEQVELFFKRLDLNHFDLDAAREEAASLGELAEADRARVADALVALEVKAHMPRSRAQIPAAGKAFAEMYRAGRVPKDEQSVANFFGLILDHAFEGADVGLFEEALGKLKERFGGNPRAAGYFQQQEKRLAELKAKAGGEEK